MTEPAATWFITRKYPPRIGGMERLSWELTTRISQRRLTRVIALSAGNVWLPFFFARGAISIVVGAARHRITLLHLGDAVLAPLGCLAKLFDVPVCVTVHGRDVTYDNSLYRLWLRLFFCDLDAYICVSAAARAAALEAGAPIARISVVGNGVTESTASNSVREIDQLLFVGRLVRRKGLEWFVRAVLPGVALRHKSVRLAVIGAGPERAAIQRAAVEVQMADRIEWLGAVSENERTQWLARAAICIAPNVRVPDDIEGYGLVAIEAAAAGCAVVAADLEGLREAIVDGEGGRLIASEDVDAWTAAIADLLDNPERAGAMGTRARTWARGERDWETVCDRYEAVFGSINSSASEKAGDRR